MNRLFVALLGALVVHAGLLMFPLTEFGLERSTLGAAIDAAPMEVVFFSQRSVISEVRDSVSSRAIQPVQEKSSQENSSQESPQELVLPIPAALPPTTSAPVVTHAPPLAPEPSIEEVAKVVLPVKPAPPSPPLDASFVEGGHSSGGLNNIGDKTGDSGTKMPASGLFLGHTPEYVYNPKPLYPRLSRRQRQEGDVLLDVLVSEKGATEEISVASSSGYDLLDDAAVRAVKKWRFVPARAGGQPQTIWVKVPIEFRLQ